MINVSDEFKELMNQRTDFKEQATVTFTDGTELELSADDFSVTNNTYTDGAGASTLPFGEAICRSISMELINDDDRFENYDFYGAIVRLYLTFALSETTEKIYLGKFTVTEPETYGTVVSITAVDDMYKADIPYSPSISFPASLLFVVADIIQQTGLNLASTNFNNSSYVVQTAPSGDYTCRQILGYAAQIVGGNAIIDRNNGLKFLVYDIDGATEYHELTEWSSLTVATSDITVTGVQTTVTNTDSDGNITTEDIIAGDYGYVLSVNNPLIAGDEENGLALMGETVNGLTMRIFSGTYIAYPLAEFMDTCIVVDRKGNQYTSIITDVDFTFFGPTLLSNSAEAGLKNGSTYSGSGTTTLILAKQLIAAETSARKAAIEALEDTMKTASGMYITGEEQDDGSTIYYLHDKPTLAESGNIMKVTSEGFAMSTDGGETYPYGFTVNGDFITSILSAEGINADWIKTGAFTVTDDDGNVIFSVDADAKTLTINTKNLSLVNDNIVISTDNLTMDEDGTLKVKAGEIGEWQIGEGGFHKFSSWTGNDGIWHQTENLLTAGGSASYPIPSFQGDSNAGEGFYVGPAVSSDMDGSDGTVYDYLKLQLNHAYNKTETNVDIYSDRVEIDKALKVSGGISTDGAVETTGDVSGATGTFEDSASVGGFTIPNIQHGSEAVTVAAGSSATATVTFDKEFAGTPNVIVTPRHYSTNTYTARAYSVSATGFTVLVTSGASGSSTPTIDWLAIYG